MTDFEELKAKYAPEPAVIPSEAPESPVIPSEAPEGAESKDLTPSEDILSEAKNLTSDSSRCSEYQEAARDSSPEGLGMTDPSPAPETKPRKKRFWKIYAICTAIFAMLICGLLGFFWQFLKEYEQTRPINVAKETVAELAEGKNLEGFIPPEANKYDCGADVAALFGAAGGAADAEVVEKVGYSTDDAPVFSVRKGGKEICSVRLRRGGKHRFFDNWTADGVFFPGTHEVDITVTDDTKLLLNGVQVSEECIVSRDVPLPGYEDYAEYTPKCVHYKIENLLYEPKLSFENDYCYPQATEKNGVWTVAYPGAKESRDDAVALAYEAAKAYVTYASSQDSPLAPLDVYLVQGSMLRARVLSFNRKYFAYHDSAEFKNMEVLDFSVYGADVYSVKLSFDYVMQTGRKEKVEKTVMTLYMLRIDGHWKIAEVASE